MQVSEDDAEYRLWGSWFCTLKAGTQLFEIEELPGRFQFIRVVLHASYGADSVYINQLFLYTHPISPIIPGPPSNSPAAQLERAWEHQLNVPSPMKHRPSYKPADAMTYEVDLKLKLEHQLHDMQDSIRSLKVSRLSCDYINESPPMKPQGSRTLREARAARREAEVPTATAREARRLEQLTGSVQDLSARVSGLQSRLEALEDETVNLSSVTLPRHAYQEVPFKSKSADFGAAFDAHIRQWQARVLAPALARVRSEVTSSIGSSPERPKVRDMLRGGRSSEAESRGRDMLQSLQQRRAERCERLNQLSLEREIWLKDPPYLTEYDEYVSLEDFSR
jgi:hypothetical protein